MIPNVRLALARKVDDMLVTRLSIEVIATGET